MIRTSPATYYRAAAAFVAAAVFSFNTHVASAQQPIDLFAGTGTPALLGLTGSLTGPTGTSGAFGPGFNGSLTLSAGALNTLSEGFTAIAGGSNTFVIAQSGAATLAGTSNATKVYSGTTLTPGATYQLTLMRASGFTIGLLGSLNLSLADGSTTVLNTATGTGLGGAVDLLSLFGGGTTDTLQFTVPAGAMGDLSLNLASTETAGLLGGSYTFQSATITQVPEPRPIAAVLLGAGALAVLRFRRRPRAF